MRWLDVPAPVKRAALKMIAGGIESLEAAFYLPADLPTVREEVDALRAAIAELERVPVHARVGPDIDVTACEERGSHLRFSMSGTGITCPTCKAKRHNAVNSAAQLKKMRTVHSAMKTAARADVPADRRR